MKPLDRVRTSIRRITRALSDFREENQREFKRWQSQVEREEPDKLDENTHGRVLQHDPFRGERH